MHTRLRAPTLARRARVATAVAEPEVLALQRTVGNQAVVRLLAREPQPSHVGIKPVTDIGGVKGEEKWQDELKANEGVKKQYSELATLLNATVIKHVKGTGPDDINGALRADAGELKPGLNFVARMGGRGKCGYLYDGKFSSTLPTKREGDLPTVAIVLGRAAFEGSTKASSLGVLRHELEHAFHNEMALKWLEKWRGEKTKKTFIAWLEDQSMAAVDKDLVRERAQGSDTNTEALSNLEGFIAAFPLELPKGKESSRPAYNELVDAAEYYLSADKAVQAEFIARLKALRARLTDKTAFDAAIKKLRGEGKSYEKLADAVVK
jgi:hypothetical protein